MNNTEAERQLAALVAMPTISDDLITNDMALDYIRAYLAERGMQYTQYRFNGHGALLASTGADNLLVPTVLLTAHVDVVTGPEELFTLRQEGDMLIGRGTYDMKFAIAGYLQLVDELQDRLADYDFGILITSDEEIGSTSVLNLVQAGLRPQICIMPDSTAPGWDIETVAKGFWRFDIAATGQTAHAARPWEGESASLKLIHALHELKTHFEAQHSGTDSLNIGKIHGGQGYNIVPAEMIAAVEIRYMNRESLQQKRELVEAICKKHNVAMVERVLCSSVLTDLDHPLVKAYLKSVHKVTGHQPQSFISCGSSDAPPLYDAGITCILSCCHGGGHHSNKEWISRESFLQFVPIMHDYLQKVAKKPTD